MNKHFSLVSVEDNAKTTTAKGLAPVVCYEPWFPRVLESIKQSIHDGHSVLIRLHSAASYPLSLSDIYVVDLESHAVLIVGYDDAKEAVAVIDPWDKNWGGNLGGRRWIPYATLGLLAVNTSLGIKATLSPLIVSSAMQWDKADNLSLQLKIGFYVPRGTVMDLQSWEITKINIGCVLPESWEGKQIDYEILGRWIVGDVINLSLPIANNPKIDGEMISR